MTDRERLLAEAHELALATAPELRARPLYVIDATQLGADAPCKDCYGFALPSSIPLQVIDAVGPAWRGPGPVIALDLRLMEAAAPPGDFETAALSVLLHEVAHILPAAPVSTWSDFPEMRALHAEAIQAARDAPEPTPGSPDDCHDWRFIRRYLHLWHRAVAAGSPVGLRYGWLNRLGVCGPTAYEPLLGPEVEAMAGRTFAEIELAPPPPELLRLWADDLEFIAGLGEGRRQFS